MDYRPTIAITMGDPAGIGAEVIVKALADPVLRHRARYIIYGMNELLAYAADLAEYDVFWWRDQCNGRLRAYPHDVVVVDYDQYSMLGSAIRSPSKMGGEASMRFCVDAIEAGQKKLGDSGVTGQFGDEEERIIKPAILMARDQGINVTGPYPGDTVFLAARDGKFDAVVAMYHDQGLIPVKLLAFDRAVNVTLGLPIIRTSPDHGTAFDIVGRNRANPGSMRAAIELAIDLAVKRHAREHAPRPQPDPSKQSRDPHEDGPRP